MPNSKSQQNFKQEKKTNCNKTSSLFLFLSVLPLQLTLFHKKKKPTFYLFSFEETLIVSAIISHQPNSYELNYTLNAGHELVNEFGASWQVEDPITITFQQNSRTIYSLEYQQTVSNAYEGSKHNIDSICEPLTKCCLDDENNLFSYFVSNNKTEYNVFAIGKPRNEWDLTVQVQQDSILNQINLQSENLEQGIDGLFTVVGEHSDLLTDLASLDDYSLFVETYENTTEGFLVPTDQIENSINKIGITNEIYLQHQTCPRVDLISLQSSSKYDQLESFRNQNLYNKIKCKYSEKDTNYNLDRDFDHKEGVFCDDTTYDEITIELNTANGTFKFQKLFAELRIIDSGLEIYSNNNAILFVYLYNYGKYSGSIEALPVSCCFQNESTGAYDIDCNNISLPISNTQKISSLEQISFKFNIYSELNLKERPGLCQIDLLQHQQIEKNIKIYFDDNTLKEDSNKGVRIDNSNNCGSENIEIMIGNILYCKQSCTIDQYWDSETNTCKPENCSLKYLNNFNPRPFYNPSNGLCQSYITCQQNYKLDTLSNNCYIIDDDDDDDDTGNDDDNSENNNDGTEWDDEKDNQFGTIITINWDELKHEYPCLEKRNEMEMNDEQTNCICKDETKIPNLRDGVFYSCIDDEEETNSNTTESNPDNFYNRSFSQLFKDYVTWIICLPIIMLFIYSMEKFILRLFIY
ncbi:hypothetical protein M0813_29242 [Anaeramoeba flamelloides]|uniref:Uncharacterized protein n=1 Tax=Anaeramoeba flamelloides TaxID=1746091 RepID=A0ABQ8XRE5_9EUKA|nr:hypothetical protein M0813_29242 [Anaeramoeba flamelloides]